MPQVRAHHDQEVCLVELYESSTVLEIAQGPTNTVLQGMDVYSWHNVGLVRDAEPGLPFDMSTPPGLVQLASKLSGSVQCTPTHVLSSTVKGGRARDVCLFPSSSSVKRVVPNSRQICYDSCI